MAAIIGGDLPDLFPAIVESFRTARQAARSETFDARLVGAVQKAIDDGGLVGDILPTATILPIANEWLALDKPLSSQQLGRRLQMLGFAHGRTEDGNRQHGRRIDPEQLAALQRKFGLDDPEALV